MNKLYNWDLYDREIISQKGKVNGRHEAWVTSGYVIAEDFDDAKRKVGEAFDIETKLIINFDLGSKYICEPYEQDKEFKDLFVEKFINDKNCLSCSNSYCDECDILHCIERNGHVVEDDGYCEEWN